jgi:TRAP-type C4-dicarboxylate transport system substrate-binding protein
VFSQAHWDTLSKADQDLLRKLSREAQMEQRQLWDAYVDEAEAKLKAAGVQFVPPTRRRSTRRRSRSATSTARSTPRC